MLEQVIYTLKREWPSTISVVKQEKSERNYDTGKLEISSTEYEVERAVVLPKRIRPLAVQQLAENERVVLIDLADIDFTVDGNDKIRFENVLWDIAELYNHRDVIIEIKIKHV